MDKLQNFLPQGILSDDRDQRFKWTFIKEKSAEIYYIEIKITFRSLNPWAANCSLGDY